MSTFRTTNPLLTAAAFEPGRFGDEALGAARPKTMTLQGTVNASLILLGLTVASGMAAWTFLQNSPALYLAGIGGSAVAFILVLVTLFKPAASPYLAPFIAIGEGLLAGLASVVWTRYAQGSNNNVVSGLGTGLVLQAGLLTAGVAAGLLVAYTTRLIKPSENFKLGVAAATLGICFFSIAVFMLRLFGVQMGFLWDGGPIAIGVSAVIVVIAALNLVLDFDFIEQGAANRLPRHMEWYAAIGLLVTLVWLYVSMLRLLAMLNRRD